MRIGNVFRLYCQTITPPKNKYLILVANRDYPVFLFINNNISNFIKNQNLSHTQLPILQADHRFLHHDSWVCTHLPCGECGPGYFSNNRPSIRGVITDQLLHDIFTAVETSHTIRRRTITWVLEDVNNEIAQRYEVEI